MHALLLVKDLIINKALWSFHLTSISNSYPFHNAFSYLFRVSARGFPEKHPRWKIVQCGILFTAISMVNEALWALRQLSPLLQDPENSRWNRSDPLVSKASTTFNKLLREPLFTILTLQLVEIGSQRQQHLYSTTGPILYQMLNTAKWKLYR